MGKVIAYQLSEEGAAGIASNDPQHFGSIPGLWLPDNPVLLDDLDPGADPDDFAKRIKELGLPIEEVKVDADYRPRKGFSQLELRSRGELGHIPALPSARGEDPFERVPKNELVVIARERGIDEPDKLKVSELRDKLRALDAAPDDLGTTALGSASTTATAATPPAAASADTAPSGGADATAGGRA